MSWFKKFLPIGEETTRTGPTAGFRVLKSSNPNIPIEPWFDFVCGINGRLIEDGNSYLFTQEIHNCTGRDVCLTLWSAKGQRLRDVTFRVPKPPSLSLTLQWASLDCTEDIWHILDVTPNSPADLAGLLPYSDYIISSPSGVVRGDSGLADLVEHHINRPLRLYVYNNEYDVTRELEITPTKSWGGEGLLGCVLGYGALHRLPPPLHEPVQAPGETLFESEKHGHEEEFPPTEPGGLITQADRGQSPYMFTPFQPPLPSSNQPRAASTTGGVGPRHKQRRTHHATLDMDGFLKEGEAKSRELDGGSSATGTKGLPPPPRSAPPKSAPPPKQAGPASVILPSRLPEAPKPGQNDVD